MKEYTKEEMLDYAWWLFKNLGQFTSDYHANFEGKYLEMWKLKTKQDENRN